VTEDELVSDPLVLVALVLVSRLLLLLLMLVASDEVLLTLVGVLDVVIGKDDVEVTVEGLVAR
jgi:hypothetical protein